MTGPAPASADTWSLTPQVRAITLEAPCSGAAWPGAAETRPAVTASTAPAASRPHTDVVLRTMRSSPVPRAVGAPGTAPPAAPLSG